MTYRRVLALGAVFGLLLVACNGGGEPSRTGAAEPKNVTLLIDFFPGGQHAYFYVALAEGFFSDEGLEVEIENVIGGAEVVKTLVAGQADFGLADYATMAVANQNQDAGLKAIFGVIQESPMSVLSPATNGISTPADLVGKKIVDFAGSSTQIVWPVFLSENGLSPDEMDLQLVDPASRSTLVTQGNADAALGFSQDKIRLIDLCDCEVNDMPWKDYGITSLSNGLMARTDYIETNQDVVRRFVSAIAKAMEFTRNNPDQAIDDTIQLVGLDNLGVSRDLALQELESGLLAYLTSPNGGGDPLGFMTEEDWQATVDVMVRAGQMEAPEDISTYYTNDFVPGVEAP